MGSPKPLPIPFYLEILKKEAMTVVELGLKGFLNGVKD